MRRLAGRACAGALAVAIVAVSLAVSVAASGGAGAEAGGFGPDVPVTAVDLSNERAQNSPSIAVDPTDDRFVALASRVDAPEFGCALHVSGDGGRSWLPARAVTRMPEGAERCYAPEVAFDRSGTLFFLFAGLVGRGNTPMGVFLTRSDDRRTFSPPRRVLGADRFQVRMALDPTAGDRGRIHLVWLEALRPPTLGGFAAPPNPILHAYSDDGGETFSEPVQVSDPARPLVVAPALAVGPGGAVHVAYYDLEEDVRDYQGLEGPRWDGTWSLVVSSAADGRTGFRHSLAASAIVPPERVMLIFTMAPPALVAGADGRRWLGWSDARHGDWDVFVSASPGPGEPWGAPVRVNDDPLSGGRHQYLPALEADGAGRLHVLYYDRRHDEANLSNHTAYTCSSDGGTTFAPARRVTTEPSYSATGARYAVPSAANLVGFGSRLALRSSPSGLLAAWTDTRNVRFGNTHQDVFSTTMTFAAGGGGTSGPGMAPWALAGGATVLAGGAAIVAGWRARRSRAGRA